MCLNKCSPPLPLSAAAGVPALQMELCTIPAACHHRAIKVAHCNFLESHISKNSMYCTLPHILLCNKNYRVSIRYFSNSSALICGVQKCSLHMQMCPKASYVLQRQKEKDNVKEVAGFGMQQSIMSNSQLVDGLGAKERKAYSCNHTLNINPRASESWSRNDTRTTNKGTYKIMKIKLDLLIFFVLSPKRN